MPSARPGARLRPSPGAAPTFAPEPGAAGGRPRRHARTGSKAGRSADAAARGARAEATAHGRAEAATYFASSNYFRQKLTGVIAVSLQDPARCVWRRPACPPRKSPTLLARAVTGARSFSCRINAAGRGVSRVQPRPHEQVAEPRGAGLTAMAPPPVTGQSGCDHRTALVFCRRRRHRSRRTACGRPATTDGSLTARCLKPEQMVSFPEPEPRIRNHSHQAQELLFYTWFNLHNVVIWVHGPSRM
jgi:hypothetical protein